MTKPDSVQGERVVVELTREEIRHARFCVLENDKNIPAPEVWHGLLERLDVALSAEPEKHILEIREDGWGLEHPRACREDGRSLLDCDIHKRLTDWLNALDGPPLPVGRHDAAAALASQHPDREKK